MGHLAKLLKYLSLHLSLDPKKSVYHFGLDSELVSDEGVWFAFNKNTEVCFETYKIPANGTITFTERGSRCDLLVAMFKHAVKSLDKDTDRDFLREVWLERLIKAVELQGAKIPPK